MGMTDMGVTAEGLQEQLKVVFAHEAAGSLARVESLLDQPATPDGRELVEALFREFHTMKVGAAAAGYSHAARALHDAESLLDAVRGSGVGLRAPDECCRHKALDLIGDLALLGRPLLGHVIAERAGHAMHAALVARIMSDPSLYEIITFDQLASRVTQALMS